jgi:adenosine deaminase
LSVIDDGHQLIIDMPKVELHLHLEGAFTLEFLFGLIEKYGGDPQIATPNDLRDKFIFRDFEHFLDLWFWKNRYFRETDDFEQCAYTTLENLANQNVIYCEVFFSPWDFTSDRLSCEEITEATIHGIKRAEGDFSITCNLIADLVRDYDSTKAVERVKQILPYKDKGIIGIGLGGSEQKYPARLFKDAFKAARDLGFHVTAHAGEAAGSESIWEAINDLKVERIGHGVRAIEDPKLMTYLKDTQIPLEVCVNSNLKTKVFPSAKLHPIKHFIDIGLNVTISSDDPTMFGATLTEEYLYLHKYHDIKIDDIESLSLNAINSSFLNKSNKDEFRKKAELFWKEQSL